MQIKSIILYNFQGETRQLDFQLGRVNIIAGGSSTGKSAIIPIIEYCLGLSDFSVPGDAIRNTVACYAVLYRINAIEVLIAKRPPSGNRTTESRVHFRENPEVVPPPLATLEPNTNDTEITIRLTKLLYESSGQSTEERQDLKEISLLHTHHYLFQKSTIIAHDSILFHRQEIESERIKKSLPYFLGIIRATDVALEQHIEDARKDLQRVRGRYSEERRRQNELFQRGQNLLREVQELGLIVDGSGTNIETIDVLRSILGSTMSRWQPTVTPPTISDPRLTELRTEIDQLREEHNQIRISLESTENLQKEVAGYTTQAEEQRLRLLSINSFATQTPFEFRESTNQCPLCRSEIPESTLHIPQISAIRSALNKLESDLLAVRREQPMLNERIETIGVQLHEKQREIERKQLQIAVILRETQAAENIIQEIAQNNSQVDRLIGRIEFFLEIATTDSLNELAEKRSEAEENWNSLTSQRADRDIENSKLRILNQLSDEMTRWAQELQIDRSGRYRLDIDELSVMIDDLNRTYSMSEIGGGTNCLKIHLITLFALHKYFIEHNQPVPGFIVLDQPAQVFFPSVQDYESLQDSSSASAQVLDSEVNAAQNMFNFLFGVCEQLSPNFQIILLEHAFFEQPQYRQALVNGEDWFHGIKLIPQTWIDDVEEPLQQAGLFDTT